MKIPECPTCKTSQYIRKGNGNLWCSNCSYFPIPVPKKMKKKVLKAKITFNGLSTQ